MIKECIQSARNVETAIELACQKLGIPREEVEIEVLELPKKGFLGIGNTEAKVRVYKEETDKVSIAVKYVEDVLAGMGLTNTQIKITKQEETVVLNLEGDGLGMIIGRRGETLDSLQYLTGLVANRLEGEYVRISIDSGNYRDKREKTLESLAKKIAITAVKTGRSTTLEPMNPYERRIIHAAVSEIEGATSTSVGEEPNRKVVISSKNPPKRREGSKPFGARPPQGNRPPQAGGQGGFKKRYDDKPRTGTSFNKDANRDNKDRRDYRTAPAQSAPANAEPKAKLVDDAQPLYSKITMD